MTLIRFVAPLAVFVLCCGISVAQTSEPVRTLHYVVEDCSLEGGRMDLRVRGNAIQTLQTDLYAEHDRMSATLGPLVRGNRRLTVNHRFRDASTMHYELNVTPPEQGLHPNSTLAMDFSDAIARDLEIVRGQYDIAQSTVQQGLHSGAAVSCGGHL